ncbi:MAG: hypothetical protein N3A66_01445, partial [Planctomycetota bacterium]|nr:hypothetical protein [Planctomycetota bacterium]
MRQSLGILLFTVAAALGMGRLANAAEIEIRFVPYDKPDSALEALERQESVFTPVQTPRGTEIHKIGMAVVAWCRGITLDGEPLFERYVDGKYAGRLPRARRQVARGRHVIWPGDHAFTVSDQGKIAVESADLAVAEDGALLLKAYPVTIRGLLYSPEANDLPPAMRLAPLPRLTVRESSEVAADERAAAEARKAGKSPPAARARDLLPLFDDFVPLTLWLPANRLGKGYALYPQGITFHLTAEGIAIGAGGGAPPPAGVRVEKNAITLPLFSYPCRGSAGAALVVEEVQKLEFPGYLADSSVGLRLYPRQRDYTLRVADHGPAMIIAGDLLAMPYKAAYVEKGQRPWQRGILAEMAQRHFQPGETAALKLQAVDPGPFPKDDAATAPSVNLLENAPAFARLQGYGQTGWRALEIKPQAPQQWQIVMPADGNGLYRLRVGVKPLDQTPEMAVDFWITVAPQQRPALGIFTPRQRTAFYRGEEFFIAVAVLPPAVQSSADIALAVDLHGISGESISIYRQTLAAPLKRQTIILRFDAKASWSLAPGRYQAIASLGDSRSPPFAFEIVEPEPKTHFDNILIGKYSPWGTQYEAAICKQAWNRDHHEVAQAADLNAVIAGAGPAERLVEDIVSLGCNGFMGMSYEMDRVVRPGGEIEVVAAERPEIGPRECYALASGRDRFLDAAVRRNLRFWENLFTYNDTSLPRGEAMLGACGRYAALEAQALRHSPAFQGVCLYDEFYYRSLNDGVAVVTAFEQAMEAEYRARYPELTSSKALKALDRYAGRPLAERRQADLETFKTWPAWEDECWGMFSRYLVAAIRRVAPASRNFTLYRYWGGGGGSLATNGDEVQVFAPLDIAACVMYKDGGYGDRPEFAPIHADTLRLRPDLRVWTQLHNFNGPGQYSAHLLRQAFLGLSQRPDGFTYFCLANDRDAFQNIAGDLCTRYGDFFLALEPAYKKVAVYYSRQSQYLQMRKPYSLAHQCTGLWLACLRAGFPADFLRDHDLLAGKALEYEAIFAPGFFYEDECPKAILEALQRLINAGKMVLVERSSRLPLAGAVRLDSDLDEIDDKKGGSFPRYVDFETEAIWEGCESLVPLVRNALGKRLAPAARHNLLVGPDWLKRGKAEYLFVANTTYAPMTGLY